MAQAAGKAGAAIPAGDKFLSYTGMDSSGWPYFGYTINLDAETPEWVSINRGTAGIHYVYVIQMISQTRMLVLGRTSGSGPYAIWECDRDGSNSVKYPDLPTLSQSTWAIDTTNQAFWCALSDRLALLDKDGNELATVMYSNIPAGTGGPTHFAFDEQSRMIITGRQNTSALWAFDLDDPTTAIPFATSGSDTWGTSNCGNFETGFYCRFYGSGSPANKIIQRDDAGVIDAAAAWPGTPQAAAFDYYTGELYIINSASEIYTGDPLDAVPGNKTQLGPFTSVNDRHGFLCFQRVAA